MVRLSESSYDYLLLSPPFQRQQQFWLLKVEQRKDANLKQVSL